MYILSYMCSWMNEWTPERIQSEGDSTWFICGEGDHVTEVGVSRPCLWKVVEIGRIDWFQSIDSNSQSKLEIAPVLEFCSFIVGNSKPDADRLL